MLAALILIAATAVDTGLYPRDITPPPGTAYPCALTALPKDLPGIPAADRAYINRTYARILRATQAKLVALKALEESKNVALATGRYDAAVATLIADVKRDVPPSGLERFHSDVVAAMELQRTFFRKAAPLCQHGKSMAELYAIGEAHDASSRLIAAWDAMSSRYPSWSAATKDSIYHHLCALDFF